jgi:hypothetical protein
MTKLRLFRASATALAVGAVWSVPAVHAQEADEAAVDALIDGSASPDKAIATARIQAQSGDLTGASATLERALLADQNANDVRIFYASLLCQLDDPQGARVELTKLERQKFDEQGWSEMNAACGGAMARPEAPAQGDATGLSGEVFAGVAYDSNTLGALAVQLDIPGFATPKQDGFALISGVRIAAKGKGYFDGGDVYGSFSARAKESIDGPKQRYATLEARLGYGRQSEKADFAVGGVVRHARLFGNSYVTEFGGQAEVGLAHKGTSRIALRGEAVYQDYANLGPGAAAQGWRFDLSAAYEKRLGEDSFFVIGIAGEAKEGKVKDSGYVGGRIFASYRAAVGTKGQYFNLSSTLRHIDFKDNPPVLDRKDTRLFARAAYGLPIGETKTALEFGVSYTSRSISNRATVTPKPALLIGVADYHSFGAELRLVAKF